MQKIMYFSQSRLFLENPWDPWTYAVPAIQIYMCFHHVYHSFLLFFLIPEEVRMAQSDKFGLLFFVRRFHRFKWFVAFSSWKSTSTVLFKQLSMFFLIHQMSIRCWKSLKIPKISLMSFQFRSKGYRLIKLFFLHSFKILWLLIFAMGNFRNDKRFHSLHS